MKLPNIRNINIQGLKDAVASKKKKILLILLSAVVLVVGFSIGGVIYRISKDKDVATIQLNQPNIENIAKGLPENQTETQPPASESSDNTSPPSENVVESVPKRVQVNETPKTTEDQHFEAKVAFSSYVYNPFEFQYDKKHAEEKLKLIKELELEEIKAKIREAQQKGKKETHTASNRISLPPLDSLPKIQTSSKESQNTQVIELPKKEVATKRIRIPGYMGVMIDSTRRAVILDDGNIYELGSPISEDLYIDKINNREVYLKDVFGNIYKLKPSAYEVTLYMPKSQ